MSMVGYVLGLGDRHPSNLMLDRLSGKILHIDFGDCFEVAQTREKFPERIPFRLTRMLINAMEVTGIEGTYRMTCQKVMRVLRNNKDSLMAVLEAFVYDPLLNWRLVDDTTRHRNHSAARAATGQQGQGHEMGIAGDVVDADVGAVGGIGVHPHHHVHSHAASTSATSASVSGAPAANPINTTNEGEVKNKKAVAVVNRVRDKLTGRDFDPNVTLDVNQQVDLLIKQATSHENLCQCYIGWCPFW